MPMSTLDGVFIRQEGPGRAGFLDPETLAAAHPLWAGDVRRLGPWRRETGAGGVLWRAPGAGAGQTAVVVGECGSVLDVAWELLDAGLLPQWGAVLAVRQSAGRGQLRRPWSSPPGNLHVAWTWPSPPPGFADLVPLAAGFMAAEALEDQGLRMAVKWPNDLLWEERKVGGILVEERGGRVLMGLGLNLAWAPPGADLREEWSQPAADLSGAGLDLGPLGLWLALVGFGVTWYATEVFHGNPDSFPSRFSGRLAWLGREVVVRGAGRPYAAVVRGLLPDGGLSLRRDGRDEALYSGSITARPV